MRKIPFTLTLLAIAVICALPTDPAAAQPARVFVAAQGSDVYPCTFSQPCRTFQHAHDVVASGGEIDVLDPAGYGSVTINKAISIQAHGFAGITAGSGATAITINAGPADAINLNGLLIEGSGGGATGIRFNTGKSLVIADSVVRNHSGAAIEVFPSSNSAFEVTRVLAVQNGGRGIHVQPIGSVTVTGVFNKVETYNNGNTGIQVDGSASTGSITATVSDSISAGNAVNGFQVVSNAGTATTSVMVIRSTAANNFAIGFSATNAATAILRLSQSTATANFTGMSTSGTATLLSYGDNNVDGNTSFDGTPTASLSKK